MVAIVLFWLGVAFLTLILIGSAIKAQMGEGSISTVPYQSFMMAFLLFVASVVAKFIFG